MVLKHSPGQGFADLLLITNDDIRTGFAMIKGRQASLIFVTPLIFAL